MTVTQQDLVDADCWFASDRAGGPEMTAFKREARWRQHRWAIDELGVTSFGTHRGPRTHPDEVPDEICNGAQLVRADGSAGANFLTAVIHDIAMARVADKQPHETLTADRLGRDLLASLPMAFNLFGEASLPAHEISRHQLGSLFGVDVVTPSDIVFEWSPGRCDAAYTNDRTAFDVALRAGPAAAPQTVVGIGLKYHEHSARQPRPSGTKPDDLERFQVQTALLVGIARASGVFADGWETEVLDTDLRPIWRAHVLALSMRAHQQWTHQTRYVLLYPSRNVSFRSAAERYATLLQPDDRTFRALTIEAVLDAAFAHGGPTKEVFRKRYLWWGDSG